MKIQTVVITGSTRGIGCGLADSFLGLGCSVTVSSRTMDRVDAAVSKLSAKHQGNRVFGLPCDVTDFGQVQALWDGAKTRFGKVDIWINNAGLGQPQMDFWELPAGQIHAVVETNLIGAMYGSKVALRGMLDQGFGALYNMEGLGSDGRKVDGLALYGATKSGLSYLDESLARETRGTAVLVGALRPGMVVTDFLTGQYEDRPEEWERAKRIFNILADRVETVTPYLARKVLANDKNGACIAWLRPLQVTGRFLVAPFRNRDLFGEPDEGPS